MSSTRTYRGSPLDERRDDRRRRLITAAIRVYGEVGIHRATIKAICDEAGLTERYFYESFTSGAALLLAAYQRVNERLIGELAVSIGASSPPDCHRAALARYFDLLRASPDHARLFLVEIASLDPAVAAAEDRALDRFATLLQDGREPPSLLMVGIVGGIQRIARRWVADGYGQPIAEVVDASVRLCRLLDAQ